MSVGTYHDTDELVWCVVEATVAAGYVHYGDLVAVLAGRTGPARRGHRRAAHRAGRVTDAGRARALPVRSSGDARVGADPVVLVHGSMDRASGMRGVARGWRTSSTSCCTTAGATAAPATSVVRSASTPSGRSRRACIAGPSGRRVRPQPRWRHRPRRGGASQPGDGPSAPTSRRCHGSRGGRPEPREAKWSGWRTAAIPRRPRRRLRCSCGG